MKNFKKALIVMLTVATLAVVFAVVASAEVTGSYPAGSVQWVLDDEGLLTITPLDNISDGVIRLNHNYDANAWTQFLDGNKDAIKKIVIKNTDDLKIAKISGGISAPACTSIIFPDTVETIEHRFSGWTFAGCALMTTLGPEGTPEGVVDLSSISCGGGDDYNGQGWFAACSSVTTIILPEDLVYLAKLSFNNCLALKTIVLPEGMVMTDPQAFEGATALKTIVSAKGSFGETYAKDNGLEFVNIDDWSFEADVTTPEDTTAAPETSATPETTTAAPETSATPETTTAAPETSATPEDTNKTEDTTGVDQATQTGDVNYVMIAVFAIAALGAAVVLLRKRSFN